MSSVPALQDDPFEETWTETEAEALRRLRLDLHDGPLQEFVVVVGELCLLREELAVSDIDPSTQVRLVAVADRLVGHANSLGEDLRRLAAPPRREPEAPALAELLERAVDLYADALAIELDVGPDTEPAGAWRRTGLSRIVETALGNVAQHSGATFARVRVRRQGPALAVEIVDDGCGFDVAASLARAEREGRLGLASVRERARFLGGAAEIESRPGGPTRVRVVVPAAPR